MMSCSTTPPQLCARVVDVGARAQAGDDDRHLVLGAHLHVVLEPVVALVHDLVDGERRAGLSGVARSQAASVSVISASHSSSCAAGRALSAGMEPTTPACALRDHQLGVADDEQRRADDGQRQVLQDGGEFGQRHQKASRASAVTALGAFDDAVAHARRLVEDVVGVEARGGDLGLHEGGVLAAASWSSATSSARAICQPATRLPASIR
jgi:hypothetical protein